MGPAGEGFDGADLSGAQVDLWLVGEGQLLVADGFLQGSVQAAAAAGGSDQHRR